MATPLACGTSTSSSSSSGASVWRLAREQDDRKGLPFLNDFTTRFPCWCRQRQCQGCGEKQGEVWTSAACKEVGDKIVWIFNRPPKSKGDNKLWVLCCQECCQQGGVRPTRRHLQSGEASAHRGINQREIRWACHTPHRHQCMPPPAYGGHGGEGIDTWRVNDVVAYLERLELGQGLDGNMFLDAIQKGELEEMGFSKFQARKIVARLPSA